MIWYATTVFLSSAILLVLEITAGRLIAPYVGVTIYSWTSIIGVILAGLSLGNWIGGRLADRGAGERTVGVVLLLSGLFSVLSLFVLALIAPWLQGSQLDLVSSSFLYVLGMFFIPAVFLGIPTPMLTTLALNLDQRTGHIVGRMHALSALGSIIGTFVTGFVLIQYVGSRNVVILSSVLLVLLAVPFFRSGNKSLPVALLALLAVGGWVTHSKEGFTNPCEYESNYFCLRVVDVPDMAPFGNARALVLDHLIHGINHESRGDLLIPPYMHLMQELVENHFADQPERSRSYFFAGGGSYTQPRAVLAMDPQAEVTVAELDPMVTRVVEDAMYVDTGPMRVLHGDARTSLYRLTNERFDVIVTDAFHDIAIPYHLVTLEFVQLVRARLRADGFFTTNVVDAFPNPRMVKSLMKTLQQEFDYVDVWLDQIPEGEERMTYILSASDRAIEEDVLRASMGLNRSWFRVTVPLLNSGTQLAELPIFTDDYVPVERLISSLLLTAEGL